MIDIILDVIIDTLKLVPFLFIAFLIIELIEHKLNHKNKEIITKSKKFGPLIGALLGAIPQCGFSVMATNLYITRIITLGTLISIYLSTSDEMLPILISQKVELHIIIKILLIKIIIGFIYGTIIDIIYQKISKKSSTENYELCEKEHCHCNQNIFTSTIKHTINISIFILIITLIISIIFTYIGKNFLSKLFLKETIFGPFITSLIGLIPNCASSVMITELYLNHTITFASLISGLLTSSGTAIIILFKNNKNIKENITIISLLYLLGSITGLIIELIIKII